MMDGTDQNPMLNLFYGHFLSEGHNEGIHICLSMFYIFSLLIH